jgi:hypothetical protein
MIEEEYLDSQRSYKLLISIDKLEKISQSFD